MLTGGTPDGSHQSIGCDYVLEFNVWPTVLLTWLTNHRVRGVPDPHQGGIRHSALEVLSQWAEVDIKATQRVRTPMESLRDPASAAGVRVGQQTWDLYAYPPRTQKQESTFIPDS
jgi:hypothetical protein